MRHFRTAVVIALVVLAVSLALVGAAEAQPGGGPQVHLQNLRVVDANGNAFPRAGIMAMPVGGGDLIVGSADADGSVRLVVDPTVKYSFTAFAINTGWCGGWIHPQTGDEFHFSDSIDAYSAAVARPTTFVVAEPNCTRFTVLDGNGQPFATAGVLGFPVGGGAMVFGSAGPDGTVELLGLDPDTTYDINGFAVNTGWACGYWTNPNDGSHWWFSPIVTGTPSQLAGTTFTIPEPNCNQTTVSVLDGNGQPFANAGVFGSPVGGGAMIGGPAGPDGTVVLTGLDPNTQYTITAFAVNTGWACGYWTAENGDHWWFAPSVTGTPSQLAGTTFTIPEPNCT